MIDRTISKRARESAAPPRRRAMRRVRVASPVAPLLAEPRAAATLTSQYLSGHALDVLEERGDWAEVRGEDDYEGWMHAGYFTPERERHLDEDRISLGCVVRGRGGFRRPLPRGALLDDGDVLLDGETVRATERSAHFPSDGPAIARSAIRFFEGTSYLWGGVTPWGADCSGLVQSVFGLHGVPMPRDADDQG